MYILIINACDLTRFQANSITLRSLTPFWFPKKIKRKENNSHTYSARSFIYSILPNGPTVPYHSNPIQLKIIFIPFFKNNKPRTVQRMNERMVEQNKKYNSHTNIFKFKFCATYKCKWKTERENLKVQNNKLCLKDELTPDWNWYSMELKIAHKTLLPHIPKRTNNPRRKTSTNNKTKHRANPQTTTEETDPHSLYSII